MTVEQACNNIIDMMVQMKGLFAQQEVTIAKLTEELNNFRQAKQAVTNEASAVEVDPVPEV